MQGLIGLGHGVRYLFYDGRQVDPRPAAGGTAYDLDPFGSEPDSRQYALRGVNLPYGVARKRNAYRIAYPVKQERANSDG